jgi:hypothetical protein
MTSGPERPDAAEVDQRSPDAMDSRWASASFAFRANNAGTINEQQKARYGRTAASADVAMFVDFAGVGYPITRLGHSA